MPRVKETGNWYNKRVTWSSFCHVSVHTLSDSTGKLFWWSIEVFSKAHGESRHLTGKAGDVFIANYMTVTSAPEVSRERRHALDIPSAWVVL